MKDNLNIGAIAEIVNKSKTVVPGILKVYNDYGSSEGRKIHRSAKNNDQ